MAIPGIESMFVNWKKDVVGIDIHSEIGRV
jgi:hypothetical protein